MGGHKLSVFPNRSGCNGFGGSSSQQRVVTFAFRFAEEMKGRFRASAEEKKMGDWNAVTMISLVAMLCEMWCSRLYVYALKLHVFPY